MPDFINISGREAFKLGLVDKGFSGSVRRSSSEVSAARAKFAPEPTPSAEEVNYDPNKGQTINAREAFKLGLVDKNFSGSVRRTRGEIDAARNNLSQPAQSTPQQPTPLSAKVEAPVASPRKKINAKANPMVSTVNAGIKPRGMDGQVDFKTKGAISTAAGGNTDYSLNYKPTKISYKGADAVSPEADRFGLRGTGQTTGLENLAKSVNTKTAAEPTRKQMRQARRAERLERRLEIQKQKGQLAMQEGRFGDAKQKNWRAQNLQKRIDRNKARM